MPIRPLHAFRRMECDLLACFRFLFPGLWESRLLGLGGAQGTASLRRPHNGRRIRWGLVLQRTLWEVVVVIHLAILNSAAGPLAGTLPSGTGVHSQLFRTIQSHCHADRTTPIRLEAATSLQSAQSRRFSHSEAETDVIQKTVAWLFPPGKRIPIVRSSGADILFIAVSCSIEMFGN